MMKLISLSAMVFLFSNSAHAFSSCFQFDVSKVSNGLTNIHVKVSGNSASDITSAQIVAKKTQARFTRTSFACDSSAGPAVCSEAKGGGDFSFRIVNGVPVLRFVYLNLLIGSTGSVKVGPGQDIDEEFALFDLSDGNDDESEDDSGEMDSEVSVRGKSVSCGRNNP